MGVYDSLPQDSQRYGYRIYTLVKNGPLFLSKVSELSDFIIPSQEVIDKKISFSDWISSIANKELNLRIYTLKTRTFKDIIIKTNDKNNNDGILGASVRYENWSISHKKVLHILKVEENSFAEKIGIIPEKDYIVAVRPSGHQILSLNIEDKDPYFVLLTIINKCKGVNFDFLFIILKKEIKLLKD